MPELLLELFSEEIPARMQARAAEDWAAGDRGAGHPRALGRATYHGPRRIALVAEVNAAVPAASSVERGPRTSAPEQALAGFLRKHGAARDSVTEEAGYWVLHRQAAAQAAASLVATALPALLRRFPWPKSMRWGGTGSAFTWVRPLRRILCLLDGAVVPFSLADGADDGHGLQSSTLTEGHRFMAPGAFPVHSAAEWHAGLAAKRVLVGRGRAPPPGRGRREGLGQRARPRRRGRPGAAGRGGGAGGVAGAAAGPHRPGVHGPAAEVMQVSMRVNQRYFALRTADGAAAPFFAFAANIETADAGAAIVAGNERVLRARFSDARYFWDADRRVKLADRVSALDAVTFHAKLGSQGARVHRVMQLAEAIAPSIGADPALAARAAWLAKADLTTGMVGEFPELQGVMGRYYALHDDENRTVANAIAEHYAPKGPGDAVPVSSIAIAAALADKLDLLASFFAIGERPTGSGDPFALRRGALGIVRIIRDGGLRLSLRPLIGLCAASLPAPPPVDDVLAFIVERARVLLRSEGARHDVLDAVFAAGGGDDLALLLSLSSQVGALLGTQDGSSLLVAHKRAANILRIETAKDGPHDGAPDAALLRQSEEAALSQQLDEVDADLAIRLQTAEFTAAMRSLASLRPPLDTFFAVVTVNDPDPALRRNRLRLLHRVRATMDRVADFSRIEG